MKCMVYSFMERESTARRLYPHCTGFYYGEEDSTRQYFFFSFCSYCSEERLEEAGQGIKESSRAPERRNMIERCPVSVFHLILAGSPSGEIPQTHLSVISKRGSEERW